MAAFAIITLKPPKLAQIGISFVKRKTKGVAAFHGSSVIPAWLQIQDTFRSHPLSQEGIRGNVCPARLARYLSINYPDFSPRFTL